MEKKEMKSEVKIPAGTTVTVEKGIVTVKGSKGDVSKNMLNPSVDIKVEGNKIIFQAKKSTRKEKKMIGTYEAHAANMIRTANEGVVYKMKICSGHFPMNAALAGNEFVIKNFLGEKFPRKIKITKGVTIKVDGMDVTIEGIDKEAVGQTAASIEKLTKIRGRDKRIFQDGIYIIEKDGKKI